MPPRIPTIRSTTSSLQKSLNIIPVSVRQAATQCSKYHSYDHPSPPSPFTPFETKILSSSIPHIPTHGFTSTTLSLGCTSSNSIPATTNLFPSGAFSLVHYHLYTQRLALTPHLHSLLSKNASSPLDITATIKALTWARLLSNKPIIHHYPEALALMSLPSNIPTSLHELHLLSDEIFYLAGDKSVDGSWYTKRAELSGIYAASEVFMTQDQSTEWRDTREFMERRFEGMSGVGRMIGSVGEWIGFTARAGVDVLRSKGVRI